MSTPSQISACLRSEDGSPYRIFPPVSRKRIMLFHPEVCDVEALIFLGNGQSTGEYKCLRYMMLFKQGGHHEVHEETGPQEYTVIVEVSIPAVRVGPSMQSKRKFARASHLSWSWEMNRSFCISPWDCPVSTTLNVTTCLAPGLTHCHTRPLSRKRPHRPHEAL